MASDVSIRISYTLERRPSLKYPNYTNVLYSRTSVAIAGLPPFTSRTFLIGSGTDLGDIVKSVDVHPDARKPIVDKGSYLRIGQKATVRIEI